MDESRCDKRNAPPPPSKFGWVQISKHTLSVTDKQQSKKPSALLMLVGVWTLTYLNLSLINYYSFDCCSSILRCLSNLNMFTFMTSFSHKDTTSISLTLVDKLFYFCQFIFSVETRIALSPNSHEPTVL